MEGWKELKQYVGDFMCKVDTKIGQMEKTEKEAYERGLKIGEKIGMEKAWDVACKIVNMIGLKRKDIFGYMAFSSVMNNFSATEAIEKIKQCGQEQEEQIQVGDEVIGIFSSGEHTKPFVITKWNSDYYFGIYSDSGEFCQGGLKLQKTGRHFPEIAEVLKRMQEETE